LYYKREVVAASQRSGDAATAKLRNRSTT